jgi:hypothetical protein
MVELGRKCRKLKAMGVGVDSLSERFGVSERSIRVWMGKADKKKRGKHG